jgi:hypothetical protein
MRAAIAALAIVVVAGAVVGLVGLAGDGDETADSPGAGAPGAGAGGSAEVGEYRDAVAKLGERYRGVADTFATLSGGAQSADEAWQAQYRAALDELKAANAEARALRPPECLSAVQDNLLAAATRYDRAAVQGTRGLETGEQQSFRLASQTITEADQFLNAATTTATTASC